MILLFFVVIFVVLIIPIFAFANPEIYKAKHFWSKYRDSDEYSVPSEMAFMEDSLDQLLNADENSLFHFLNQPIHGIFDDHFVGNGDCGPRGGDILVNPIDGNATRFRFEDVRGDRRRV